MASSWPITNRISASLCRVNARTCVTTYALVGPLIPR
jgi:hypothetical protein